MYKISENLFVVNKEYYYNNLDEALSKAELGKAELELEINKVKTEEVSLRDALLKMQALNEGLGQDKIELNKIIMQVRDMSIRIFTTYGI